ncbi:sodium-dependent transporter [Lachnobacterium bovis]|uniref:Transporter n=1 Tax=Lachnobacterium bovis TaxID=140626 RepID=A0A1H9RQX0_9FIRM|nr:sodium-dependent transporter [Lachnobacterium bovis]SER75371.1 neurotransmitter:Na+ symporter, NSS family [Lachnobacterium bovis]
MEKKPRSKFSSKLGFVLAAAGSAVGLGNIWRFPYLAAKYGGGIFLLVYLILAFTFGYTMIMTESTLGRSTEKSPVGAFKYLGAPKWLRAGGWLNAIIPLLIVPYYSVIGGWVMRYLFIYLTGQGNTASKADAFNNFIGSAQQQVFWFVLFAILTMIIIFGGVKNGIEAVSKIMMPILVFLAIVIVFYSVTRPGAIEGVKYFLIPNFKQFSYKTVVAALGQMFYSLSIAMGILYTFGSYMEKDIDIEKTTKQVEIFDTAIAILAGLMVIPAVFAFDGGKNLNAGPGLMFVALPKVFNSMGFGRVIGIVFFLLVLLAAVTSSVALAESVVSTLEDELHFTRKRAATVTTTIMLLLGMLSALGFNVLSAVKIFDMDILSFFDFLTNSVMMPIAAIATCLLVLKVVKIDKIEEEIMETSEFRRRRVYRFVIKYVAIIFLIVILVTSILGAFNVEMFKL